MAKAFGNLSMGFPLYWSPMTLHSTHRSTQFPDLTVRDAMPQNPSGQFGGSILKWTYINLNWPFGQFGRIPRQDFER